MSPFNGKKLNQFHRKCERCGKGFETNRDWKRFCSQKCQWEQWNETHPRVAEPQSPPYTMPMVSD